MFMSLLSECSRSIPLSFSFSVYPLPPAYPSFVLCSVQLIASIVVQVHISKASGFLMSSFLMVQWSSLADPGHILCGPPLVRRLQFENIYFKQDLEFLSERKYLRREMTHKPPISVSP